MHRRISLLTLWLALGPSAIAAAQPATDPFAPEAPTAPEAEPPAAEAPETPAPEAAPEEPAADASAEIPPPPEEPAADASAEIPPPPPEEAPVEAAPAQSDADEIVVTGSRIRRPTSFGQSAPVDVIDRKQLEYSGASNLADVVQHLTVAQGSGVGAGPSVAVNLRGLGDGATLLLINGRRSNPTGTSILGATFADLSVIPLAAVERVEILKAGASAIYGADAVGGVINVITRKNYDGARFELDGQTTEEFDHREGTGSFAFGSTSDRSRVLLAGSYFQRSELLVSDRDFTKGRYISTQGFPGTFLVGAMTSPDAACDTVAGSAVRPGTTGMPVCGFDYREYTALLGNAERVNAMGSAEYDLTNHTTAFGELNISRYRGDAVTSPALPIPAFPLVPADHIDNPFPGMASFIGRPRGAEAPEMRNTSADDSFRGVLGLKGDFEGIGEDTLFSSWEWELYSMMGISRGRASYLDTLTEPFLEALNSCGDVSDLSGCFNPFYTSVDGTGTPNSQDVIDSFSGEQVSMSDHALQTYNAGLTGSLFELPGGDFAFALGGEIRHEWRATELDHDSNELRYAFYFGNDDNKAARDIHSAYLELSWPFYDGIELQTAGRLEHYTDTESTPISPFAGLTVTPSEIAGRDNFPEALRKLQLRGNASLAFRAPTMYESSEGCGTLPTPLRIPPSSPLPAFTPVRVCGNPEIDPETATAISGGLSWSPIDQLMLTGDYWSYDYRDRIQPENATQIVSLDDQLRMQGMAGDPRIVRNPLNDAQVLRINTKAINIDGSWVTNGIDFGLMLTFHNGQFGGSEDDWGRLSVGTQGTYTLTFDIPRHQAANRTVVTSPGPPIMSMTLPPADCEGSSAVDFDADMNNNTVNDRDTCHVAGKRNANNAAPAVPVWRLNFPLVYTISGHSASAIGHYVSGFEDDVEPNLDGSFDDVPGVFTFDLQYGYTLEEIVGKKLTLRVGMYNVLDTEPPLVNGLSAAFEAGVHDPRGRMLYAKLSGEF